MNEEDPQSGGLEDFGQFDWQGRDVLKGSDKSFR